MNKAKKLRHGLILVLCLLCSSFLTGCSSEQDEKYTAKVTSTNYPPQGQITAAITEAPENGLPPGVSIAFMPGDLPITEYSKDMIITFKIVSYRKAPEIQTMEKLYIHYFCTIKPN